MYEAGWTNVGVRDLFTVRVTILIDGIYVREGRHNSPNLRISPQVQENFFLHRLNRSQFEEDGDMFLTLQVRLRCGEIWHVDHCVVEKTKYVIF